MISFKHSVLMWFLCAGMALALLGGCRKAVPEKPEPPEPVPPEQNTNGETVVRLEVEAQKLFGIKMESPVAAEHHPEGKLYGRVLDASALASMIGDVLPAEIAADASRQEWDRLKVLASQNNASTRALQAAEASAKKDQLTLESARMKLSLGWGDVLNSQPGGLTQMAKSLSSGSTVLVRLDLPMDLVLKKTPTSARLFSMGDEQHPAIAKILGPSLSVDPQTQNRGLIFILDAKSESWPAGSAVTGFIPLSNDTLKGVIIPRSAVVRHQGRAWIYLMNGDEYFSRHEISTDWPVEAGWFVDKGVTPADQIAVEGAGMILSTELSASGLSGTRE